MPSMPTKEHSSLIPRKKASSSVYKCSKVLEPTSRFPLHLSQSTSTLRNMPLHLETEVTDLRPTIHPVVLTASLMVEWMVMLHLALLVVIYHLHLVETWLEVIHQRLSVVVPPHLLFSSPMSPEDPCLATPHLRPSRLVNLIPEVNEMPRCTTVVIVTH
jgi:hypothetical protein